MLTATAPAIELHGVTKRYGNVVALNGLTLAVPAGSLCGYLGRNGAGKTTTIRTLVGLARPGAGTVRALGLDPADRKQGVALRQRLGFVGEDKEPYPYMTVGEMISFTREFFPRWRRDREQELLRLFELRLDQKAAKLSAGNKTKLVMLLSLARGADLLILDEPTEGLDPVVREQVLQALVQAVSDGATVFFSTHQLGEVEQIADRVCIVAEGRAVLQAELDELRGLYRRVNLSVRG